MPAKVESSWVSPNDMFAASKQMQLDGREPVTNEDWMSLVNFWAFNAKTGLELPTCEVMRTLYDADVSDYQLQQICLVQQQRKASEN